MPAASARLRVTTASLSTGSVIAAFDTSGSQMRTVEARLAYDRMTAHIFGKRSQNSLPPHESTKPPASSKAFQNGSDERRIASAASVVTPRAACMAAISSRREVGGRSSRTSMNGS
jgi:hypothetical protein